MSTCKKRLAVFFFVLLAVLTAPLRASIFVPPPPDPLPPFFAPETYLGDDTNGYPVFHLDYFGTFIVTFNDPNYFYKLRFGWLYNLGSTTSTSADVYLYDYQTGDTFYTAAKLYPYFYSFTKRAYLYYFEGSYPRQFYDFGSGYIIPYPLIVSVN